MGIIAFENKLKNDTSDNIALLKNANLKVKMISGDHILSCINCAFECGILEDKTIVIVDFNSIEEDFIF